MMYRIRINTVCFWGLFALFFLSCSEESSFVSKMETASLDVDVRLEGEAATRAGGTPVAVAGAEIGLFRTTQGGYAALYDVKYAYSVADGGTGQWTSADPVYVDKRVGKIMAYYDPNRLVTFGANSTVTGSRLTAQAFDDTKLWYFDNSHTDVSNTNARITFSMKPAYSRIKLSIQRHATNYVDNCAITNVNLKSGTVLYADNAFDLSSGMVQGSATAGGWTYALNTGNIAAGATNTSYDVLVPPQPVSNGLTITLTIDGVNRAVTIPATKFTSNALAAGQQYTIALMITDTAVTPSGNVAITDYATDGTAIKNNTPKEV